MNYAVAVALVIAMFALGWWWAGARKVYTGPRTRDLMHETQGEGVEERGGSDGEISGREAS
jgi:hypothetical protein